eukprot:TRINITY_DN91065_c0_g1_i1.p1 TRINITY_DN91065_c0_g1~~TRINITY_DN91065_c0_g1_i1.p1  ORF type:complete len:688 (-),score=93.31 TRINITY_DN91065_c0_g1_i1:268-2331(-)
MPRRRRILLATNNALKVAELEHSLSKYDVEVRLIDKSVLKDEQSLRQALTDAGEDYWVKAVFEEHMSLFDMPAGGASKLKVDWEKRDARVLVDKGPEHDCRPLVACSQLTVYQLPMSEQKLVREKELYSQAMSLHTHPLAAGMKSQDASDEAAKGPVEAATYQHMVEGYIDFSRRDPENPARFGWDDVFVLKDLNMTFTQLMALGCTKVSPRDINVNSWVMEKLYYSARKATTYISKGESGESILAPFESTIAFAEGNSVGKFVASSPHFNNEVATSSGLRDVFVAVANHGAFFRAAHTRREVNYWLPGLNAGIPFVPKKDPIHEVTFTAHDFGHFSIPDLVYTGGTSKAYRRTYILYRMMSEATTLVFADMLFVETLRRSGYEYDWTKRKIHPLFLATGVDPFAAGLSRQEFLAKFRILLEANVEYCLTGKSDKWLELIRSNKALDTEPDASGAFTGCKALNDFKEKYMPFFVEDYRWTSANYTNMEKNAKQYAEWWKLVEPMITAMGLGGLTQSGIGLETVDQFMEAIGVSPDSGISSSDLIWKIFDRVFSTRLQPIFEGKEPLSLNSAGSRRTQAFVRYMVGQCIIFTKFPFLEASKDYANKIVTFLTKKIGREDLTEQDVAAVRGLYNMYLRTLVQKSLISTDDASNYAEICPLFDPVYVFYDENKAFYQQLAEVQKTILEGN